MASHRGVSMIPGTDAQQMRARLLVWWVIWAGILFGLLVIYAGFGRAPAKVPPGENPLTGLIGLVPLFVSIIVRWLVLPRAANPGQALVMFIVGLALAESSGILGIFLGGVYKDDIFFLGVLGVAQFVPLFARKLFEPRITGFIPNR
jgi:hypothetical protein